MLLLVRPGLTGASATTRGALRVTWPVHKHVLRGLRRSRGRCTVRAIFRLLGSSLAYQHVCLSQGCLSQGRGGCETAEAAGMPRSFPCTTCSARTHVRT